MFNLYLIFSAIFLKLEFLSSKRLYTVLSILFTGCFVFIFSGQSNSLNLVFTSDFPILNFNSLDYSPMVLFFGLIFISLTLLGYANIYQVLTLGIIAPIVLINPNPLKTGVALVCAQSIRSVKFSNVTNVLWLTAILSYTLAINIPSLDFAFTPLILISIISVLTGLILSISAVRGNCISVQCVKAIFASILLFELLVKAGFSTNPLIVIACFLVLMTVYHFYFGKQFIAGISFVSLWTLFLLSNPNVDLYLPILACASSLLLTGCMNLPFKTERFKEVNYVLPRLALTLSLFMILWVFIRWHFGIFGIASLSAAIMHNRLKSYFAKLCDENLGGIYLLTFMLVLLIGIGLLRGII